MIVPTVVVVSPGGKPSPIGTSVASVAVTAYAVVVVSPVVVCSTWVSDLQPVKSRIRAIAGMVEYKRTFTS
ncbi:MAG TPA: hypothetical protein VF701_13480 [Thermoanaerobaculia bacterium]